MQTSEPIHEGSKMPSLSLHAYIQILKSVAILFYACSPTPSYAYITYTAVYCSLHIYYAIILCATS